MELRQLRYFVAVAETGNISRAAQKLFLTQPALSRQIKALEDEIGQCVLERRANSIRLTRTGEALRHEARELLKHADLVIGRARTAGQGLRLRVGYAPSPASGTLSTAVENFTQLHPGAQIELFDLSTAEMLAGLESEKLDVIITVKGEAASRSFKWIALGTVSWKLAVGLRHPLARRARATPADVAREPLLYFCQRDFPEYWDMINGWLHSHRQRPHVSGEYDGAESLLAAVESGLGVAVVTTLMARLFPKRVSFKSLSTPPESLCLAVAYKASRSDDKPLAVFVEQLRTAFKS